MPTPQVEKQIAELTKTTAVELDTFEKLWVQQALKSQKAMLIRKRSTEQPGSAIHELRGKEIQSVENLIQKLT